MTSCAFDALTFTDYRQMRFTGAFLSARQHPQYWDCQIELDGLLAGERIRDTVKFVTPEPTRVAALAAVVKQQIHALGITQAYRLWVTARVVDKAAARREAEILRNIPLNNDPYVAET